MINAHNANFCAYSSIYLMAYTAGYQFLIFSFFLSIFEFLNSWDEWVGLNNLVEYTEENVQKYEVEKSIKPGRSSRMKPKGSAG